MSRKPATKTDDQEVFDVDELSEVNEGANRSSSQNKNSVVKGGRKASTKTSTLKKPYSKEGSAGEDEEELESEDFTAKKKGGGAARGVGRGRDCPGPACPKVKPLPKKQKKKEEEGPESRNSGAKGARKASTKTDTLKKPYSGEESTGEDEEEIESEEEKPKKKGGGTARGFGRSRGHSRLACSKVKPPLKKQKKKEEEEPESDETLYSEDDDKGGFEDSDGDVADAPEGFTSGCFTVLKSDIDNAKEDYPVWKIHGRSLLQKFVRVKSGEETLFKGISTYAGWTKAVMDTHYPVKIEFKSVEGVNLIKFDPSQIKKKD